MSKDNGGPAFPNVPDGAGEKWHDWDQGMTLRDYFAAKAMQELLHVAYANGAASEPSAADGLSKAAYVMADAMLEARK